MKKPTAIQGYNQSVTEACERVLVTLIRHLGPWRDSIFLVGGLTPRYLIKERPPLCLRTREPVTLMSSWI